MEGYKVYLETDLYDQIDEPLQDGPDLDQELRAWLLRSNSINHRNKSKTDQMRRFR